MGNAVNPRRKFSFGVKTSDVDESFGENLLHNILDIVRPRKKFPSVTGDFCLVAPHQQRKRVNISLLNPARDIFVVYVFHV